MKYNVTSVPSCLTKKQIYYLRKPYNSYSDKEIEYARNNPAIIHFTSKFLVYGRAWILNNNHVLSNYFNRYSMDVPQFSPVIATKKSKFIFMIIHIVPKNLMCFFAGLYYKKVRLTKYEKYKKRDLKK